MKARPFVRRRARMGLWLAAIVALCASSHNATALELPPGDFDILLKMAEQARAACLEKGYPTTVTIVGNDGQPIVVLRSVGAPIHTVENSFNKAYTVMTLGPLEHQESTSGLAGMYKDKQATSYGLAPDPLPHMMFGGGGVLVRLQGRPIGGLGVSGSLNGVTDESCARKGLESAQ